MIGSSASPTGLANARLHMVIHGFAFWKVAKPAHEHDLQASPSRFKPGLYTK